MDTQKMQKLIDDTDVVIARQVAAIESSRKLLAEMRALFGDWGKNEQE